MRYGMALLSVHKVLRMRPVPAKELNGIHQSAG
jgi:hypothetical protein